ncbi:N-acyl homoserine lactonase family protein [Desulfobacula sp.]|uniref:N-acyl homoserine lactonase family protein n=1 Tax=Desulfobacula sp. TaxID=2593537 RepID=UPI0025BDF5B3|nr:N-acyl homoserine lactonase family protein [Desulfobacula sp.]MBC2706091.1 N-acyl homoserine lactonase family protein [Desulfobacula sp.]
MAHYTIHPVVMGTKVFDKSMMTYQYGQGEQYTIPIYTWVVKGGDKHILVDTGEMSPIQSKDREDAIGGKIYTFEQGLGKHGLTPSDIDIVIHTHLHMDHCENDYKCGNAIFYIHEKELESIHDPHPLDYRYLEDYIDDIEENGQIEIIREDCEILDGIRVKHTPVHTKGGLTVYIETKKGIAAITGFCVIDENFNPPPEIKGMEMDVIPPGTHVDVYRAYDIMNQVQKEADILIPLHEPRFASIESIG